MFQTLDFELSYVTEIEVFYGCRLDFSYFYEMHLLLFLKDKITFIKNKASNILLQLFLWRTISTKFFQNILFTVVMLLICQPLSKVFIQVFVKRIEHLYWRKDAVFWLFHNWQSSIPAQPGRKVQHTTTTNIVGKGLANYGASNGP